MSTTVEAPPPRNIGQETQDTLQAQIAAAPQMAAMYQKYAPQLAQTDVNILGQSLFGPDFKGNLSDINSRLTTAANQQTVASNTALRQGDLADVAKFGGQVQDIQRGANKELFGNLTALDKLGASTIGANAYEKAAGKLATAAPATVKLDQINLSAQAPVFNAEQGLARTNMRASLGQSGLMSTLEQQAAADLARGGELSAQEQREALASARAGSDARGLGYSNAGLAAEVLNLDSAKRARLDAARNFAGAVDAQSFGQRSTIGQQRLAADQLNLQATQANQNYRLGGADLNNRAYFNALGFNADVASRNNDQKLQQAAFNQAAVAQQFGLLGAANQMATARRQEDTAQLLAATQARLGTYSDPFQGVLGRASSNVGMNQNLFGNAAGATANAMQSTQQQFNPFNAYAADLYNTNYNGAAGAAIATANNRAGLIGAGIGALGMIGGGFLSGLGGAGAAAGAACWLARAAFGRSDPRWRLFRRWLLTQAPDSLVAWYLANGRRAAANVERHPSLKPALRGWMEARIRELNTPNLQTA